MVINDINLCVMFVFIALVDVMVSKLLSIKYALCLNQEYPIPFVQFRVLLNIDKCGYSQWGKFGLNVIH